MSLTPAFLDELRSRLSMAQVAGRKVMWDQKKSNQGKGDMWAPCPFHQEKTASFHVDDRKGYYYCFGCHAKGDAISFVRETENVGFMEAVEILAGEAGLQMPARDPRAQEKADRRSELTEVMEKAVRQFRMKLKTAEAAAARDYLSGRGLTPDALERWEIGFAPDGWQGLWDHLKEAGVADDLIVGAGLAKPSTKGGKPYDTFRNRIMFPIRDARGRAMAFGGRAMDPEDGAKYLNSPETDLFDKGRSLYNHAPAREAAGQGQPLIVAEGYMDVIALSEAGFRATVAPLGTAITEDQLRLLWRIHDEPIIALDGDTAGLRAAMRVIDTALPLLEAGKSLRFAIMPEGQDPDDLLRARGRSAMEEVLAGALPMVQLLWRRETEDKVYDSPERRAALDADLRKVLRTIQDKSVRDHYADEVRRLRAELFGGGRQPLRGGRSWPPRGPVVQAETKSSLLAAGQGPVEDLLREAVILAALIHHPGLIDDFADALEDMEATLPEHEIVRQKLLGLAEGRNPIDEIPSSALEKVLAARHVRTAPGARPDDPDDLAMQCLSEELAKLSARRGAEREVAEAMEDMGALPDEGLTWRLTQAAKARERSQTSKEEDKGQFDVAANGLRINREERSALDTILRQTGFTSGPKGARDDAGESEDR